MRSRAFAIAALLALAAGCSEGGGDAATSTADTLARERAAALFERGDLSGARRELAPLVEQGRALLEAAKLEFAQRELERAAELLGRVDAETPDAQFLRGQLAREQGRGPEAVAHFERALQLAPADLGTLLALAGTLNELGRVDGAEARYRELVELGIENAGSWYVTALYRLERLLRAEARDDEAAPLAARQAELEEAGARLPGDATLRLGTLGRLGPPPAGGSLTSPAPEPLRFERAELDLPGLGRATRVEAHDLDGDLRMDLVAVLPDSLLVALNQESGWRVARTSAEGAPGGMVLAADLDNDVDLDLVVELRGRVRLLFCQAGEWLEGPEGLTPELPAPPWAGVAVDYDHDGDLDLALAGPFGARLWRNDGAWVEDGRFSDASGSAGMPSAPAFEWVLSEDFDSDGDVDLLYGGPDGAYLADNLRAGRFADETPRLGEAPWNEAPAVAADFDADGRPDLWLPALETRWLRNAGPAGFEWRRSEHDVPPEARALDLDLDGAVDLAWDGGALLAAGLPQERTAPFEGVPTELARGVCLADFDGDLVADLLRLEPGRARLYRGLSKAGDGMLVRLLGAKDNRRAVGAVVELRSGPIYRRLYYRGEPEPVGVGREEDVDVFRVRWPNGVTQTALDRGLDDYTMGAVSGDSPAELDADVEWGGVEQQGELIGSCPFLYTWNGKTHEFVTDVLGITPLGLPMAPGQLVPPDHDEYVLVTGEQLVPRDGRLVVQITEELREVTYLDRVRLDVIDHPADTELWPNERFCFPPFPEPHAHTVRAPLAPLTALASDGQDHAAALRALDGVHAAPFVKHPPQFQGMTEPWFLELAFEPEAVARAAKLRLVMTGWLRWSNASANMAAARHPGVDFVPPTLQVPDGAGGWRDAGPPVGFPAGKSKTMVLDVTGLLDRDDPRLRVACTLELYWDRVALAVDGDDAERRATSLEPAAAELWERGFSAHLPNERPDLPERFDWDVLAPHPKWDQHPGLYTRFGGCLELLTAVDDRCAILGSGDALTVSFDARELPPVPPGFRRDYLLYLDGWAKDRDPNTHEALAVEPLPFHGMSGYPYGPDERFPDDAAHEAWRAEWNTRPARAWVAPLGPGQ